MTFARLVAYFFRLGATGFGGPVALAAAMERELVEERQWFTADQYRDGLTLAQLAPGPLAAQLAIYLGWAAYGVGGATAVAIAFVLPSFAMVIALSAAYVHYGAMPWLVHAFHGVAAAVIAVLLRGATRLTMRTMARDRVQWAIFAVNAALTAITERELVSVILLSGLLLLLLRSTRARAMLAVPLTDTLWQLALYFGQAGAIVFGSGLAIVPFLHGGVVERYHWLTERQFLDAVAVAMITPGPVVITVAFIGYLVAGFAGAVVASIAVFLPCYLFVVIPAPHYHRIAGNRSLRVFIDGVTAAAIGAIAGAVIVLGRRAIVDIPSIAICVVALLLLRWKRMPEAVIVIAGGAVGLLLGG
jgi:chromate transporter